MSRAKTKTKDAAEATLLKEGDAVPAVQDNKTVALAQADPIFAIIERLAKDPSFDVDKMERLINMHDRAKAGQARAEFDQAMSLAQQEMKMIRANKSNSQTNSKYATQAALDKVIRPIYTKHGFALSLTTGDAPNPQDVRVLCTVSHRSGHRQEYKLDVPADGKGAKGNDVMTRTHAVGAALTYGGRYLEKMIFNLAIAGDSDGNDAADPAERAKIWTDAAITHLNTAKPDKDGLAKYTSENEKAITWLKKNAPDQFERYQTAYSNAAEAAGIKKEEPRRGKKEPESKKKDAPATTAPTSTDTVETKPGVTDVVDENAKAEPITFETYTTARAFFDFCDEWLADPKRTPAEAKAWEEHYRTKIQEMMTHEFERVREAMSATLDLFHKIVAKEQPE